MRPAWLAAGALVLASACTSILGTFDDNGHGGAGTGGTTASSSSSSASAASSAGSSGTSSSSTGSASGSSSGGCSNPAKTCTDGVKDCSETDVDCGGTDCGSCPTGKHCNTNSDCFDVCVNGTCSVSSSSSSGACNNPALTCFNGAKDCQETDVDCGGPDCEPCAPGKHCNTSSDCFFSCLNGTCTSS
jgi:hypothetical protein